MAGFKRDLQYIFYATRSGLSNQKYYNVRDHMRAYYILRLGSSPVPPRLTELERRWLRLVITTNGGTPSGNYLSDLWKQACMIKGITPNNMVEQNQINYWTMVTSANGM